jgi:2-polyprenyl-6-methoxyphenol hydroxylase-like FAD-dependent oxidoreductase
MAGVEDMREQRDIIVAGAGIGGLTAAIALAEAGHRVTLCEAAPALKALGVGINVLPHAVAVLARLGLLERLRRDGIETEALIFANRFGQTIHRDPRGIAGGAGWPQISIHRGALHRALAEAAERRLGQGAIRTSMRLTGYRQAGARVLARFGEEEIAADLLVAADGIHSAARAQFRPGEGAPRWNGVMMWRGTTVAAPFLGGRTMVQAGTGDAKFVVYPIETLADGRQRINWIADIRQRPERDGGHDAPAREEWMKPGRLEDLMPVFGGWRFDWLDVPALIRGAEQILEWPMVDRDPLPGWIDGGMALLGDAAHPMYPIGSNGATQAILDAEALTDALASEPDLRAALQRYEAARLPMTREIVRLNRARGIDAVLDLVDRQAPQGFSDIAAVLPPAEIAAMIAGYKAAAGHRVS